MKVGECVGRNIVIENPVVNSPFTEPRRHFRFDDDGITDELVESRRTSSYFIPIASAKKKGKLGWQIKCVVSVSMLTEGWDANTVTHVLGVRAFGTQLLCEQVVGRGLRRMSYSTTSRTVETSAGPVELEVFPTEYAEVYGVPFSFIPCSGHTTDPKPGPIPTHVRAVPERVDCEITFPRLDGYRYELPAERLDAKFDAKSRLVLTTQHVPTQVENAPIVGETAILTLDELKGQREQKIAFHLAHHILEHYFEKEDATRKPWLFPDLLAVCRRWMAECLVLADNTFPGLLLLTDNRHDAADQIYKGIVAADDGEKRLVAVPKPYDTIGSTLGVSFDTVRPTYKTRPDKCHISHVVGDTGAWEQKLAQTLEDMDEVLCYMKNHNLGFFIPYTTNGQQRNCIPDFIAYMDDWRGKDDPLKLIIEMTGQKDKEKEAKVATLWVLAVNNAEV